MTKHYRKKSNVVNGCFADSGVVAIGRGACRGSPVVIKKIPCALSGAPLASSVKRTTASQKGKVVKVRIGSANVGSMVGRSGEVVEMVGRRNIDFCCLQETRWRGESARVIEAAGRSYKFFWKGGDEKGGGVGVLVAEKWIEKVIEVRRCSERIMLLRVLVGKRVVNLVSVYAPQAGRSMEEKEGFWVSFGRVIDGVSDREGLIVCGDMNGHVGSVADGFEGVHGGNGYGVRNVEGEMLLEFADAKELTVLNTVFKKQDVKKITFASGGNNTQIDYILMRASERRSVVDVKVIPGEPCLTQHRLLVGVVKLQPATKKEKISLSKCRVWKLREPDMKRKFQEIVQKKWGLGVGGGVDGVWSGIRDSLREAAEEVCGRTKGMRKHRDTGFWSEEIGELVKVKRQKFITQHRTGEEVDKEAYRVAKRVVKKAIGKAKDVERGAFLDKVELEFRRGNGYKWTKQLLSSNKDVVGSGGVKNAEGKVVCEEVEMRKIWKEYHEKLLNEEFEWDRSSLGEVCATSGPAELLSLEEVRRAIAKSRDGKAAGPSGVVCEMLKAWDEVGVKCMTDICNAVVAEGKVPEDWKRSWMVNVYKGKGDALECGSYRGIKLLEQPLKVLERVVERRIRRIVEIDDMQCGFTPGRGTTDAIFVVRQVQERFLEKKRDLWMAFVDLEKAFDRVPRDVLWWALRKMKVDEWLIKIVQAMYEGAKTAVRIDGGESEEFGVRVGVHQGSVLSPLLFIIVIEALSREFKVGLPWEVLYADDLVLLADSEEALSAKLKVWKEQMEVKGLRVNIAKTKVMKCGVGSGQVEKSGKYPCPVCRKGVGRNSIMCVKCESWVHKRCSGIVGALKGITGFHCDSCKGKITRQTGDTGNLSMRGVGNFERIDKFCYLGDMMEAGGGVGWASRCRVRSAWSKFRELAPLLAKRGASLNVKGKLYSACVRSVMTYGSETWATGIEDLNRLVRAERMMVRTMCGVALRDGKSSVELLGRLGIVSVAEIVERGRLRWYGHVERKGEEDWVSKCRKLEVAGDKGRGRPRRTWQQCVASDRKKYGMQRTEPSDKVKWRECCRSNRPTRASMESGRYKPID